MSAYRVTVDVELPESMDDPLMALASILLAPLEEGGVTVWAFEVRRTTSDRTS